MRRNKVLNTLAAASMAAMMAVTAVPATTVLAAPAEKQTLVAGQYNAILGDDNMVYIYNTDGSFFTQRPVDGNSVSVPGYGKVSIQGLTKVKIPKITGVKMFAGQNATISGDSINGTFDLSKNDWQIPSFAVSGGQATPTSLTLVEQDGKTVNKPVDLKNGPLEHGKYELTVKVTGTGDYKDYAKTFTFSTINDNDKKTDETIHYSIDSAKAWGNKIAIAKTDVSGEARTPKKVNGEYISYKVYNKDGKEAGEVKPVLKDAAKGEYELDGSQKLAPGKYSLNVSFEDYTDQEQPANSLPFSFEITKRDLTVDPAKKEVAYKGSAYYPLDTTYTLKDGNDAIANGIKGVKVTGDGVKQDASGKYYVIDSGNYTVNFDLSGLTFTKGDVSGKLSDYYNAPSTAAYSVVGNREQNITLNIEKAYDQATGAEFNGKYYNGEPVDVKAVGQSTGAVTYTYQDADGKTLTSAPTDAGKYTVTATVAGDKNYKSASKTESFEIKQQEINVAGLEDDLSFGTLTYDGKKQVPDTTLKANIRDGEGIDTDTTTAHGKRILLTSDKDFKLEVAKNDDGTYAGKHSAVLTLLNKNYKLVDNHLVSDKTGAVGKITDVDSATVTYTIDQLRLVADGLNGTNVTVEDAEPGKTPVVHVYANDGYEVPSDDYSVTATNNNKVGTGKVVVAGIKNAKAGVKNVTGSVTLDYNVVAQATVEKTDLYRLYNKNTGEHFFTTNAGEKDNLVKAGWNFEGVAMKTVKDGGTPVYRLYNKNNGGEHVYTTSKGEANSLVRAGWAYEGVAFNAAKKGDKDAVKVYRVYNPNKVANNHHYTQSWGEKTVLVKQGWRDEGVAFYAYKAL